MLQKYAKWLLISFYYPQLIITIIIKSSFSLSLRILSQLHNFWICTQNYSSCLRKTRFVHNSLAFYRQCRCKFVPLYFRSRLSSILSLFRGRRVRGTFFSLFLRIIGWAEGISISICTEIIGYLGCFLCFLFVALFSSTARFLRIPHGCFTVWWWTIWYFVEDQARMVIF